MREKLVQILSVGWKKGKREIDSLLKTWIMSETYSEKEETTLMERAYIIIYGKDNCQYNNDKKFCNFTVGYRYCMANCQCQREESGEKIKIIKETMDKETMLKKLKATMVEKYGVENSLHLKEVIQKRKETNIERFGFDNPMQNEKVQNKFKITMTERYGAEYTLKSPVLYEKFKNTMINEFGIEHALQLPEFKNKLKTTMIENYGVEYTLQSPVLFKQIKDTMVERYGAEYPMQINEFKEKKNQTNLKRYGVENTLQNLEVRTKARQTILERFGVENHTYAHIPLESIKILKDRIEFCKLMKTSSVNEAAHILGVGYSCIGVYCKTYGIDLPSSSYESAIISFLKTHNINYEIHNRKIIKPLEIDIILLDYKIGIEFCGLYWHSESTLLNRNADGKNYHLNKLNQMNNNGYKLVTIFEDEWLYKREIVQKRLLHLIGLSEKGKGARQLTIKSITAKESNSFLDIHHIQGAGVSGYAKYGAFDGTELIAVMTFTKPRIAMGRSSGSDELLRFATNGKNYPGVASRLFRTFIKEHNSMEVISYADRRWSDGNLYKQLGFELVHETKPNYWYIDNSKILREHRFKYRKDRIIDLVENGNEKTEIQIMDELGRDRIFDCGSLKFIWKF